MMPCLSNLISLIKLLFVKDKELYVYVHGITGFYPRNIELYKLALVHRSKPLQLPNGRHFGVHFDCQKCQMYITNK